MKRTLTLTAALLAISTNVMAQNRNLIRNGSFESGSTVRGTQWALVTRDEVRGWLISGKVDHVEKHWPASHGKRSLDLAGGTPGLIQQNVPTLKGRNYTVIFDLAAHHLATSVAMQVYADGQSKTYAAQSSRRQSNLGWTTREFTFTAKQDNSWLHFRSLTGGNFGPTLDNVRCFETTQANLVRNGSFERDVLNANYRYIHPHNNIIRDWEISRGSVTLRGRNRYQPESGVQCVELYGQSNGTIRQFIDTIPGRRYVMLFNMAGNNYPRAPKIKYARVTTGNVQRMHSVNLTGLNGRDFWWAKHQSFVATSTRSIIEFHNPGPGTAAYTAILDNVRVYADPDPNLIANGSFESVRRVGTLNGRSTDLAGWQVDRSIDVTPNVYWRSADGSISIDLDGLRQRGSIRCYFSAVPGRSYVLRFKMSANADGPARIARGRVYTPDGRWTQLYYDSLAARRSSMNYLEKVITFTAKSKNETIVFDSLSAPTSSYGIVIDDVHLAELGSGSFQTFGHACKGNGYSPRLSARSALRVGRSLDLHVSGLKAGFRTGLLFVGFSRESWGGVLQLPFDNRPLGARGCATHVSGDLVLPFFANKTADLKLPVPNDRRTIGLELNAQALILDPQANLPGFLMSNAGFGVIGD